MRRSMMIACPALLLCACFEHRAPVSVPAGGSGESEIHRVTALKLPPCSVQAVTVDRAQGLEVATVCDNSIDFLDASTLAPKRSVHHGVELQWYTRLISLKQNGEVQLLDTGGGYQPVGLRDENGRSVWTWHWPHSQLPPDSLAAADLDGDHELELYASDRNGIARLDAKGVPVWHRDEKCGGPLLVLPAAGDLPATVANTAGRFDFKGEKLGELKLPENVGTPEVVRWNGEPAIGSGTFSANGSDVYVSDLDGKILFHQKISPDFGVNDVLTARLEAGRPEYVIAVGASGLGQPKVELSIFKHDGTLVFRELRDSTGRFVVPDVAPGLDALYFSEYGSLSRYVHR